MINIFMSGLELFKKVVQLWMGFLQPFIMRWPVQWAAPAPDPPVAHVVQGVVR